MPINVDCSTCGASFNLKDEFAGRKVRCPHCQTVLQVDELDGDEVEITPRAWDDLHPAFQRDKFLLRQKAISISEKYMVWDEEGAELLFVERPAHTLRALGAIFATLFVTIIAIIVGVLIAVKVLEANQQIGAILAIVEAIGIIVLFIAMLVVLMPKRHITFYSDKTKSEKLLEVLQDDKFVVLNAWYTVRDVDGLVLGRFRKNYLYDIFRKHWHGYTPEGELHVVAMEDSLVLSLLRRLLGPLFGILRTNFVIAKPGGHPVLGEFNRKFTLLDRYVLDMSLDRAMELDRRLAIALGVLLDTGERR